MNQEVKFKIYDHTAKLENGMGVGVNRDIYASVWLELMDSLFVGATERVPYVRHNLYFEKWEALGSFVTSWVYLVCVLSNAVIQNVCNVFSIRWGTW